jgi:hypothetical protein
LEKENRVVSRKLPAEQAGIKIELGQNKIESLIKLASTRKDRIS